MDTIFHDEEIEEMAEEEGFESVEELWQAARENSSPEEETVSQEEKERQHIAEAARKRANSYAGSSGWSELADDIDPEDSEIEELRREIAELTRAMNGENGTVEEASSPSSSTAETSGGSTQVEELSEERQEAIRKAEEEAADHFEKRGGVWAELAEDIRENPTGGSTSDNDTPEESDDDSMSYSDSYEVEHLGDGITVYDHDYFIKVKAKDSDRSNLLLEELQEMKNDGHRIDIEHRDSGYKAKIRNPDELREELL